MENAIKRIFQSPKTVLTIRDLRLILHEIERDNLKARVAYYVKQGVLIRLARGVFAKSKEYNLQELATSIYAPSYISFETVLRGSGMIFQHYDTVFCAGRWSISRKIRSHTFTFRKLKDAVLYNSTGIINNKNTSIASKERAFLDTIYLFPKYYFDNLAPLDWNICFEMSPMYNNDALVRRLKKYQHNYAR